jgi:hyaluronan synthase
VNTRYNVAMLKHILHDWKTLVGFLVIAGGALTISLVSGSPTYFGITLIILLFLRLLAGIYGKARLAKLDFPPFTGTSTLVVPFYNEDPLALKRCLESIVNSSRTPTTVVVIDDHSESLAGFEIARALAPVYEAAGVEYEVIRLPENAGKRNGLAVGFMKYQADVYLGVDSDTIVGHEGIEKLLAVFSNEQVTAATGVVLAANAKKNLLTRLIDLRYANAFLFERAAYSAFGSVLCCCGSLAAYRGWIVRKNIDDFLTQKFLGAPAVAGDDRRLTNYCLQEGRVLLVEDAYAETLVPERMKHYLKQQIRWNKSFFRESLWVLRNFKPIHPAWILSFVEMFTWIVMSAVLIAALVIAPATSASWALLASYLVFVFIMAYARSVRYFSAKTRKGWWLGFLIAPVYGFLHIGVLLPMRLYALATLKRGGWGTREHVEVALKSE